MDKRDKSTEFVGPLDVIRKYHAPEHTHRSTAFFLLMDDVSARWRRGHAFTHCVTAWLRDEGFVADHHFHSHYITVGDVEKLRKFLLEIDLDSRLDSYEQDTRNPDFRLGILEQDPINPHNKTK